MNKKLLKTTKKDKKERFEMKIKKLKYQRIILNLSALKPKKIIYKYLEQSV